VLPHKTERRLWYIKRASPKAFDFLLGLESKRWMKKMQTQN